MTNLKPEAFTFAAEDPLAAQHAAILQSVKEAEATSGARFYQSIDLRKTATGERIYNAKAAEGRRYVLAALGQLAHWDAMRDRLLAEEKAANASGSVTTHSRLHWRRRQTELVFNTLMRRSLPLEEADLVDILNWCSRERSINQYSRVGDIVRALERYASNHAPQPALVDAMCQFAAAVRRLGIRDMQRFVPVIERLCEVGAENDPRTSLTPGERLPSPKAAPAGSPVILTQLKQLLGMLSDEQTPAVDVVGPDRFLLPEGSRLRAEHHLITELLEHAIALPRRAAFDPAGVPAGERLLALNPESPKALFAILERHASSLLQGFPEYEDRGAWAPREILPRLLPQLLANPFQLKPEELFDAVLYLALFSEHLQHKFDDAIPQLVAQAETEAASRPLSEGERYVLALLRESQLAAAPLGKSSPVVRRLSTLIADGVDLYLLPGDGWGDIVNTELSELDRSRRGKWAEMLQLTSAATSTKPSNKWVKQAKNLIDEIGTAQVSDAVARWLAAVPQAQQHAQIGPYCAVLPDGIKSQNADCVRGLLWLATLVPDRDDLIRTIGAVGLWAYKKVPGVGPRQVKIGNAAVYALSQISASSAVAQLAMLKARVKGASAQKEIEKAFDRAAESLNLPRAEIEELAVPSYGLDEVGKRSEVIGEYRVELKVMDSDAELSWFDSGGKCLKSVPAKVKSEHKSELKEIQQAQKDIQAMLPAQRDRLDSMFLLEKSWPIEVWRERYLTHPLVGTIARRVLWRIDGEAALFVDEQPTDMNGQPIAHGKTAEVTLWHPVGCPLEEITSWRRRLEELGITQPFKQAHREVYLLTDAERNTRTYSNRFAAHVLRQHQFNALCAARHWKNKLRLMVDDSYAPPSKELPQWGMRAEFWVEGIGNDYGTDTNEAGVFLRLASDQVRFYRLAAAGNIAHASGGGYTTHAFGPGADNINEPLPLEQIPPLVFSEVMRDVDLFVGVASVGNDPAWQDGGPQGRYRDYWHTVSFGELSGTAATRKDVLERLVPRLTIAQQCSFSDRFLIVQGQKRIYKIHLGSGNILMEPNDQYLCIVPDARARAMQDDLFLPFEGDSTLSIILSKALLLAEDHKIKDPTITRQINRA